MIAIKDCKMPVDCQSCFARFGSWCRLDLDERMVVPALPEESVNGFKPEWCPLVDVPDIHVGKCSETPNNSDCVSRQAAIDALKAIKYGLWEIDIPSPGNCPEYIEHHKQIKDMMEITDGWIKKLMELPSVQPKTTQVLAEVLDGCPLLHPCDELCKPEGWCREHCKEGQNGPDKDCWMRYAEVMASERSD